MLGIFKSLFKKPERIVTHYTEKIVMPSGNVLERPRMNIEFTDVYYENKRKKRLEEIQPVIDYYGLNSEVVQKLTDEINTCGKNEPKQSELLKRFLWKNGKFAKGAIFNKYQDYRDWQIIYDLYKYIDVMDKKFDKTIEFLHKCYGKGEVVDNIKEYLKFAHIEESTYEDYAQLLDTILKGYRKYGRKYVTYALELLTTNKALVDYNYEEYLSFEEFNKMYSEMIKNVKKPNYAGSAEIFTKIGHEINKEHLHIYQQLIGNRIDKNNFLF